MQNYSSTLNIEQNSPEYFTIQATATIKASKSKAPNK